MQQVHSVKTAANQDPPDFEVFTVSGLLGCNNNGMFFIKKMGDSTHLLSATCDTFISTLEECLRLAKAELNCQAPHHSYPTEKISATTGETTPTHSSSPSDKRSGRLSREGP